MVGQRIHGPIVYMRTHCWTIAFTFLRGISGEILMNRHNPCMHNSPLKPAFDAFSGETGSSNHLMYTDGTPEHAATFLRTSTIGPGHRCWRRYGHPDLSTPGPRRLPRDFMRHFGRPRAGC